MWLLRSAGRTRGKLTHERVPRACLCPGGGPGRPRPVGAAGPPAPRGLEAAPSGHTWPGGSGVPGPREPRRGRGRSVLRAPGLGTAPPPEGGPPSPFLLLPAPGLLPPLPCSGPPNPVNERSVLPRGRLPGEERLAGGSLILGPLCKYPCISFFFFFLLLYLKERVVLKDEKLREL